MLSFINRSRMQETMMSSETGESVARSVTDSSCWCMVDCRFMVVNCSTEVLPARCRSFLAVQEKERRGGESVAAPLVWQCERRRRDRPPTTLLADCSGASITEAVSGVISDSVDLNLSQPGPILSSVVSETD